MSGQDLIYAILGGDLQKVKALLESGADPHVTAFEGLTALEIARGKLAVVTSKVAVRPIAAENVCSEFDPSDDLARTIALLEAASGR